MSVVLCIPLYTKENQMQIITVQILLNCYAGLLYNPFCLNMVQHGSQLLFNITKQSITFLMPIGIFHSCAPPSGWFAHCAFFFFPLIIIISPSLSPNFLISFSFTYPLSSTIILELYFHLLFHLPLFPIQISYPISIPIVPFPTHYPLLISCLPFLLIMPHSLLTPSPHRVGRCIVVGMFVYMYGPFYLAGVWG